MVCPSPSRRGSCSPSSAPMAPARRPCSTWCPVSTARSRAACTSTATTSPAAVRTTSRRSALPAPFRASSCSPTCRWSTTSCSAGTSTCGMGRSPRGRAPAMAPKLLLLDEPAAGMNLEETQDLARFILDIRDELGISMVMVEHDMGLVMDLADRLLAIDFGTPLAQGTPAEVAHDPAVIQAYLGQGASA